MRNSYPTFSHEFSYVNFTDIYFSFKISIMPGYQLTIFQLGKLRKMTSKYFIAVTPKYFHNKLLVLMFFSIQLHTYCSTGVGGILLVNLHLVKITGGSYDELRRGYLRLVQLWTDCEVFIW